MRWFVLILPVLMIAACAHRGDLKKPSDIAKHQHRMDEKAAEGADKSNAEEAK